MLDSEPRVQIAVASRFENIELVQVVLEDSLKRWQLDEDQRHWIGLAVREALANAIKHGNQENPEKRVEVDLHMLDGEVVIRVRDQGVGFDPENLGDPLAPENLLKPGGRGIFYMRRLMDGIEYRFEPVRGTEVILRKRVTEPEAREPRGEEGVVMKIEERNADGVVILDLEGKITIGIGDVAVRDAVQTALAAGNKNLLLNLAGVSTIDSAGVGELVSAYTTVTNRGGKLKLLNLPPKVNDILQITQLFTVFEIFDDEREAVESFG